MVHRNSAHPSGNARKLRRQLEAGGGGRGGMSECNNSVLYCICIEGCSQTTFVGVKSHETNWNVEAGGSKWNVVCGLVYFALPPPAIPRLPAPLKTNRRLFRTTPTQTTYTRSFKSSIASSVCVCLDELYAESLQFLNNQVCRVSLSRNVNN